MIIKPSEYPGAHERHLLRKAGNALFEGMQVTLTDDGLLQAQREDHALLQVYQQEFVDLLEQSQALAGHVESDTALALKERLERAYETASALGGQQDESKAALRKLLQLIMLAIRRGAGGDQHAQQELDQEEAARQAHFALLESPLVADLLNPASVISAQALLPTLLSAEQTDLALAVQLFDQPQLQVLLTQGEQLLARLAGGQPAFSGLPIGQPQWVFMAGYLEFLRQG